MKCSWKYTENNKEFCASKLFLNEKNEFEHEECKGDCNEMVNR